jgi:hypothetical protein
MRPVDFINRDFVRRHRTADSQSDALYQRRSHEHGYRRAMRYRNISRTSDLGAVERDRTRDRWGNDPKPNTVPN